MVTILRSSLNIFILIYFLETSFWGQPSQSKTSLSQWNNTNAEI